MDAPPMSRVTKHAMLQRHMASYDKLLQYAVSRFSCSKLYQRLLLLHHMLASPTGTSPRPPSVDILSLNSLRQALNSIAETSSGNYGQQEAEETSTEVGRYFDSFFEDLQFLRELKKYFDQRIHKCLYEYYYDPTDDLDPEEDGYDNDLEDSSASAFLTGRPTSSSPSTVQRPVKLVNKQQLGYTVRELYTLCTKWDDLLSLDEFDPASFDIESAREICIFPNVAPFEPILRLIPDLFSKSFRALELAQVWKEEAYIVYGQNLDINVSIKDINKKQEMLKERILSLTLEIAEAEETLETEYSELRLLQEKETRHLRLDEDCRKVESRRKATKEKVTELVREREKLHKGRHNFANRDKLYKQKIERELLSAEGELQILDFRLTLLREDYDLELLFLPDIVRFVGEVEERVKALEQSLQEKKARRQATEKTIGSIKKNCAKMREIVDKYYKHRYSSGVSVETNEAGDTLSTCTSTEDAADMEEDAVFDQHLFATLTPDASANSAVLHSALSHRVSAPSASTPEGRIHSSRSNSKTVSPVMRKQASTQHDTLSSHGGFYHQGTTTPTTPNPSTLSASTVRSTTSSSGTQGDSTPIPPTPRVTPNPSSSRSTPRNGDVNGWDSVSQSGGILKQSGRRSWGTGSLPTSPFREASIGVEGKESSLSETPRIKTVRWKSPPVSDESDNDI